MSDQIHAKCTPTSRENVVHCMSRNSLKTLRLIECSIRCVSFRKTHVYLPASCSVILMIEPIVWFRASGMRIIDDEDKLSPSLNLWKKLKWVLCFIKYKVVMARKSNRWDVKLLSPLKLLRAIYCVRMSISSRSAVMRSLEGWRHFWRCQQV